MNFSFSYILSLVIRSLFLGSIVFASTTYIPDNVPSVRNRIIISAIVVALFALIDYISQALIAVRNLSCNLVCGSHPGANTDIDPDIDLDSLTKPDLTVAGNTGTTGTTGSTPTSTSCPK